jgi:hypothetical protein
VLADAVQARDDGDVDRFAGSADQIQVLARTDVVVPNLGKVRGGFAAVVAAEVEKVLQRGRLVADLFLEQREHHDGRCTVVFEATDAVEVLRERRCRSHQRVPERQAHVTGRHVHGVSPAAYGVLLSFTLVATGAGT